MPDGQVHHMDVVADAGPVRGVVVISEHTQLLQLSDSNL